MFIHRTLTLTDPLNQYKVPCMQRKCPVAYPCCVPNGDYCLGKCIIFSSLSIRLKPVVKLINLQIKQGLHTRKRSSSSHKDVNMSDNEALFYVIIINVIRSSYRVRALSLLSASATLICKYENVKYTERNN